MRNQCKQVDHPSVSFCDFPLPAFVSFPPVFHLTSPCVFQPLFVCFSLSLFQHISPLVLHPLCLLSVPSPFPTCVLPVFAAGVLVLSWFDYFQLLDNSFFCLQPISAYLSVACVLDFVDFSFILLKRDSRSLGCMPLSVLHLGHT